ncbi:polysaccharide deacetylase family protein [Marinimicrobium alkaliphilum]|uniref:polysaccharide deacetylase family protein n=1 Tax=Marinimicrobium alkaliphilum TaxID=2202654 RepID=UPI000DB9E3BD|nr:polysaccharide deacetylase family protein [Marinimicrobium alkaliphilum]
MINRGLQSIMFSHTLRRCFSGFAGPYVTIFTLHRPKPENGAFNGISETFLRECLDYARKRRFTFVGLDEVIAAARVGLKPERPQICITLDDGYEDQLTRLVPVLLEAEAKPTLFAITDFADDLDWPWDAKVAYAVRSTRRDKIQLALDNQNTAISLVNADARVEARRRLVSYAKRMSRTQVQTFLAALEVACDLTIPAKAPDGYRPASWDLLRASERQGLVIGSHSRSHNLLNAMDNEQVAAELNHSQNRLSTELVSPSGVFCYPSGTRFDFAPEHEQLVKQAGYKAAVSTISKVAFYREIARNPFRVARIGFPNHLDQFARYTSWLEALRSKFPV